MRPRREGLGATLAGIVVLAIFWGGCASPTAPTPPALSSAPETAPPAASELVVNLLELAARALAQQDVERARQRYERVIALDPASLAARVGLARIELQRGDPAAARAQLVDVIGKEGAGTSRDVDLALVVADIEEAAGRSDAARSVLYAARRSDPRRYDLQGRLEAMTGRAAEPATEALRLEYATRHPFDPAALRAAADAARTLGYDDQARRWLEEAVWLADVDAAAARAAFADLQEIHADWASRRIVPVHVIADRDVRAETGWKNRLRFLWRSLSVSLDPLLGTAFVPVSFSAFDSQKSQGLSTLTSIDASFRAQVGGLPPSGLIAVFSERPPPRQRQGQVKLGQAGFFGRELLVRLDPGQSESRVLAHEILHLYGGVHISDKIGSLMNPSGRSLDLDPVNVRVARVARVRSFGAGGIEANVIRKVDVAALSEIYLGWLEFHLVSRKQAMVDAREEARTSRFIGATAGRRAAQLDPHMADVAAFTANLMLEQQKSAPAANLFLLAGRLYGADSSRGRAALANAERLRAAQR